VLTGRLGGVAREPESWLGSGGGALYLIVQGAEVFEASEAGVGQADQDGEQHHQEGEQGGRGLQTWGQRRQPWGVGAAF
jgi:hypothetical protein